MRRSTSPPRGPLPRFFSIRSGPRLRAGDVRDLQDRARGRRGTRASAPTALAGETCCATKADAIESSTGGRPENGYRFTPPRAGLLCGFGAVESDRAKTRLPVASAGAATLARRQGPSAKPPADCVWQPFARTPPGGQLGWRAADVRPQRRHAESALRTVLQSVGGWRATGMDSPKRSWALCGRRRPSWRARPSRSRATRWPTRTTAAQFFPVRGPRCAIN